MLLHEKIEKILTELNNENLNVKEAKDTRTKGKN